MWRRKMNFDETESENRDELGEENRWRILKYFEFESVEPMLALPTWQNAGREMAVIPLRLRFENGWN